MYTELFSRTTGQMEQALLPARRLQQLMVEHTARLADFQLQSLKNYSEMGIDQWRALQDVKSPEDLQALLTRNTELVKTLSEKLSTDINELTSLHRLLGEELQKVTQDTFNGAMEDAAGETMEPAAASKPTAGGTKKSA